MNYEVLLKDFANCELEEFALNFCSRIWSHPSMSTEVFGNYQFHMLRFFGVYLPPRICWKKRRYPWYQYLSDPCIVYLMIFYAYIYYKSDPKCRQICKSDGSYEI